LDLLFAAGEGSEWGGDANGDHGEDLIGSWQWQLVVGSR
jgi:hypothetical protein